jgi:hypothetical protein
MVAAIQTTDILCPNVILLTHSKEGCLNGSTR